jgi:glycosyltransferase involved in cell wall biosynthesis
MRLLFAHDHRFTRGADGSLYSSGPFPIGAWDRYLQHFDELLVVGRDGGLAERTEQLTLSSAPNVEFELFPNLSSPRQLLFPSPALHGRMREAVGSVDAVVARLPSEIGALAIHMARQLGKPYAVEMVGCAWDGLWNNGSFQGRIYAPLAWWRTRRLVSAAPLVLYVTSSWLQGRYPTSGRSWTASNVALVPMSAAANSRRDESLAELAKGRRPTLGTIASLRVRSKGIQTALAALAALRGSGRDYVYRVLGPGDTKPWRQLADKLGVGDLVHFDGTREAGVGVREWLENIDIHLQPSFQEGLPRATIEAMSSGSASIGSTCGGIPELLPAERLHKPGDIVGLCRIIRRLASDPEAIAQASRRDRESARAFDPQTLNARRSEFFGVLRSLTNG